MDSPNFLLESLDIIMRLIDVNPKLYGNDSAGGRLNALGDQFTKDFPNCKREEAVLIQIPEPVYAEAMKAFKDANFIVPSRTYSDMHNMKTILLPAALVQEYTSLIPEAASKTCPKESLENIKGELIKNNIPFSIDAKKQGNDIIYSVIVGKQHKEMLNAAFMKYESITRSIDNALADMVINRMQDMGIPCRKIDSQDRLAVIQYLKSDQTEVNNAIKDLKNVRSFSEKEFNNNFGGQECIEFPLKDDVEINRFMDIAIGKKFDYTITRDNIVKVPVAQKDAAIKCKNQMLEELYHPLSINEYELAKADARIQDKTIKDIVDNKGMNRYFVSAAHPEYYAILEKDNSLTAYKRVQDKSGEYLDAPLIQTHQIKDPIQVGIILNYLGTPIEISEEEFNLEKLGDYKTHPYKETIEKTIDQFKDNNPMTPDNEMKFLQGLFIAKEEEFLKDPKALEEALDKAVEEKSISEDTKNRVMDSTELFISRNKDLSVNSIHRVRETLDEKIANGHEQEHSKAAVEQVVGKTKETVFKDDKEHIEKETERI